MAEQSFRFTESMFKTLRRLGPEDEAAALEAICRFAWDGEEPAGLSDGAELAYLAFSGWAAGSAERSRNNVSRREANKAKRAEKKDKQPKPYEPPTR